MSKQTSSSYPWIAFSLVPGRCLAFDGLGHMPMGTFAETLT
jgi:hypothetical protein